MSQDDRRIQRSGSVESSFSQVSLERHMSDRNDTMGKVQFLLSELPPRVKDFDFEVQREFSRSLDDLKENGDDWRIVASRLGFSNIIRQLEQGSQPTIELLRQCTKTTCEQLLEILVNVNRSDVLDDLVKFCSRRNTNTILLQHLGSPTQESDFSKSISSSLSWPLQDSGCESMSTGGAQAQAQESEEKEEDFLSDESKRFWLNIPGDYERKSWTKFCQAAENACPKEMQQGNVQKFLSKLLSIETATDKIGLDQFLELVALFGPFKPGPDGCLQKMYDLMRYSTSVGDGGAKESWFAGRMNETESAERLSDQAPGHYLLRISSSRAHHGVFVLAVKTKNKGVVQIQIERDLQNGTFLIADGEFKDLKSVVDALRRDVLLENCKQLLINPCPGLPLNAIFTGYVDARARQGSRGRGKPRK